WTKTPGGPQFVGRGSGNRDKMVLEALRFRVPVRAGPHLVQVYFVARTAAIVEDLFDPYLRREPYKGGPGPTQISSVTVTMPAASDPAAPMDSPSRRRLLVC